MGYPAKNFLLWPPMGTRPKVILRRKNFGISKMFTSKMADKLKIMLMPKNPCARCCLILIFSWVKQNYPRKNILKIQDNLFCLLGEKYIFMFLARPVKTEKSTFLQKDKKGYFGFSICFFLGNSASLTKKLASGNFGHIDFLASTLFWLFRSFWR